MTQTHYWEAAALLILFALCFGCGTPHGAEPDPRHWSPMNPFDTNHTILGEGR